MKSVDTYLCRKPEREFSFYFYGVDYYVGDRLSEFVSGLLAAEIAIKKFDWMGDDRQIKLRRFVDNKFVDCTL